LLSVYGSNFLFFELSFAEFQSASEHVYPCMKLCRQPARWLRPPPAQPTDPDALLKMRQYL